jgi:Cof subfamily protein (haloacid dehalogenase superfamily)
MSGVEGIRMIASDLDNTLLTSAKAISPRTNQAISDAHAAGLILLTATGRQLATMPQQVLDTDIGYAVASNGAVGFDFERELVMFTELLSVAAQQAVVDYLSQRAPGVAFSAGRGTGDTFYSQPEYLDQVLSREKLHDRRAVVVADLPTVISEPTIKLVVRHPEFTPDELLAMLDESGLSGFHATTSGAPFVEIAAGGINKATGLAQVCAELGLGADEVMAVGDAKNDVEMLEWAGIGVAMANARPEAKAAADFEIPSNEEDGLAQMIEAMLSGGEHFPWVR